LSTKISYLSNGQILQRGKPSDMYNYPKTRELAEFMGKTNWLKGSVKANRFHSIFGQITSQLEDTNTAYQLLRPHDLRVDLNGSDFTIISSHRIGKETITTVQKDDTRLVVTELLNHPYQISSHVGVQIINNYAHVLQD